MGDIVRRLTMLLHRSLPLMAVVAVICLLSLIIPVDSALWAETLTISGTITTGELEPPHGQAGTTLAAYKTVTGIEVFEEGGTSFAIVSGDICVWNGGDRDTVGLRIVDEIQIKAGSGQFQYHDEQEVDVSDGPILGPHMTEEICQLYAYAITFELVEGAKYKNAAHVTIDNHSGWLPGGNNCPGPDPCPFGPDPKSDAFTIPLDGPPLEATSKEETTTSLPDACGDAICNASIGEDADNCPEDCINEGEQEENGDQDGEENGEEDEESGDEKPDECDDDSCNPNEGED